MSSSADWSALLPELLQTIAGKLPTATDYIRARAVCQSWRSGVLISRSLFPREFPWLMLPLPLASDRLPFCDLLSGNIHRLCLPEASQISRCAGSSFGWLVLLDESPSILLVNPISRRKITLPPLSSFPNVTRFDIHSVGREYTIRTEENDFYHLGLREMRDRFIKKVILSHNPYDGDNFNAFAILNPHVAYCKGGDTSWTIIDEMSGYCEDVIYSHGKLYAVDKLGSLAIYNVTNVHTPELDFIHATEYLGGYIMYLVETMGELSLVSRYLACDVDIERCMEVWYTVKFQVFRFNWDVHEWESMESLDDHVLFLGRNSSLALVASDYAGCMGMGNMIYFTDDYSPVNCDSRTGKCDVGVYSLAEDSVEEFPVYSQICQWPVWITPTLC